MKYRLKKEAVPFVLEKHATAIYELETWRSVGIDMPALEEVKDPFIKYGHNHSSGNGGSLCGWSAEKGSEFYFTINFPSVTFQEHDVISKGRITRELMDKVQRVITEFYFEKLNIK